MTYEETQALIERSAQSTRIFEKAARRWAEYAAGAWRDGARRFASAAANTDGVELQG